MAEPAAAPPAAAPPAAVPAAAFPGRLTLADQAFANAAAFLSANVLSDPRREDIMIDALRDLLPQLSRHRMVEPVARAARYYLAILDEAPNDLRRRGLAKLQLCGPVADFLFFRFAAAREALADAAPPAPPSPAPGGSADDATQ